MERFTALVISLLFSTTGAKLQRNNFSPSTRNIHASSIYQTTGNVTPVAGPSLSPCFSSTSGFLLAGPNASVTYDFGQLVAGRPTINIKSSSCQGTQCSDYGLPSFNCTGDCHGLRLGYTESPLFIDDWGGMDWTTWYTFPDGPLYLPLDQLGKYTIPGKWARGSFRYLTLSLGPESSKDTSVSFELYSLHFTAAPNIKDEDLGSYTGYFTSSDELLNQIWNAGVYTIQLNTMSANTSLNISYFLLGNGWANDATSTSLSSSDVFIADGAKRNRNPWSADFSIFFRSALVSQNFENMRASRNGIQANFILQDRNRSSETYGYFPYAGSPLGDAFRDIGALGFPLYSSDTYQCWAMLSLMEYFISTGDYEWAETYWPQLVLGINATFPFLDPDTGLFNGTRTVDWGRDGQGGQNIALNALYYHTLTTAARLAPRFSDVGNGADPALWLSIANRIKQSANSLLWDEEAGLFRDNITSAGALVYPQDGNALAIRYNLTLSPAQSLRIAEALSRRWTSYGAPSAELRGYISPFATSHELLAQFAARPGDADPALHLLRTQWGYMLRAFSNETCVEGYADDGSLGYGFYGDAPAFISLAHAFSTGPTYALHAYVAGLRVIKGLDFEEDERDWAWMPAVNDAGVDWVRGGFVAPGGRTFDVEWRVDREADVFWGCVIAPAGEVGVVYVPMVQRGDGGLQKLLVNGTVMPDTAVDESGMYYRIERVPGGRTEVETVISPY
ncbi:glycoside hydrolase family 78 protein [Trematosphaeria pertusa]|uniref:Glycoside hydrolase family 78 protein n=1 Tax=Trematosphaeria pertusa TaxID=390896 RepID=A0A6A6IL73_9PLEO|nr:glycoside hydrolase family 78 protein [Trematosphaeria pertusa]KAF2251146.1 glycoside hydrolase family 78 protein [Trematosphaeria pertusa]